MALRTLNIKRARAGRKPQNVDLETIGELRDFWAEEGNENTGVSPAISFADRLTAQKIGQAYATYLRNHYKFKVATVTGKDPENEDMYVFQLTPVADDEDGRTMPVEVIPPDQIVEEGGEVAEMPAPTAAEDEVATA